MFSDTNTSRAILLNSRIKPVVKTSISEDIVTQIMNLISNGDLKPGQRLPSERELCKMFSAGRSSLREALRCLSIVGILDARVGEGTLVATDGAKFFGTIVEWRVMTEKHDVEDMMELRIALEGLTAASAARRRSEQDLAKLQALLTAMADLIDDEKRFAALDLDFHLTLAEMSENVLIFELVAMIRGQLARTMSRVLLLPNARPLSLKEHTSILRAIKRGNAEEASLAMQAHLRAAIDRYQEAVWTKENRGPKRPSTKISRKDQPGRGN
jgi:GntR family transcriptional repressor for pyruvate dehydrogenase complex